MTKEEKISLLKQEGFKQKGDTYEQTFFIKYGKPYLGHGHFDRDEFLKYRDKTYSITEFEKENGGKTEKRYVIEDDQGRLTNWSLGKLKYHDKQNKDLFVREEECIKKFAEYGVELNKGDILVCMGYIPNNEQVEQMMENAQKAIRNYSFANGVHHYLDHCGHEKQANTVEKLFNGGILEENREWTIPYGANSSHEQYIVDNLAKPVLKAVIQHELDKGRYLSSNLVKTIGHDVIEQNTKNYLNKLTPNKLIKQGISEEASKEIVNRIKRGEEIPNPDRLLNIKDAAKLAEGFQSLSETNSMPFNGDKFVTNYVFSNWHWSEYRDEKIGTYLDLKELSSEPDTVRGVFLRRNFLKELDENNLESAIAKTDLYKNFVLDNTRISNEQKEEIENFWKNNFKMILPYYEERLKENDAVLKAMETCSDIVLQRTVDIISERENDLNVKDTVIHILGHSALTPAGGRTEPFMRKYLVPLIGEYVYNLPEFKELKNDSEKALTKCINYLDTWSAKHGENLIDIDKQEEKVYRLKQPQRKIQELIINKTNTLEEKRQTLKQINEMDFNKPETLENFEKKIYDLYPSEKCELIDKGEYINNFFEDRDEDVRIHLIDQGYGKDELINDKRPNVTEALVRKFGCENLKHLYLAEDWRKNTSKAIAKQGWGIDEYLDSKNEDLKQIAHNWLDEHKMTIDEYIEKYPERCFIYENQHRKIAEETKKACEKMDDAKNKIIDHQEHLTTQSQIK